MKIISVTVSRVSDKTEIHAVITLRQYYKSMVLYPRFITQKTYIFHRRSKQMETPRHRTNYPTFKILIYKPITLQILK